MSIIGFSELSTADLLVDAIYQGGRSGNSGDDPLPRLLRVSNSGGFRYRGNLGALEMVVLTSSFSDPDWPDSLDRETGLYTYYGDNKKPGVALHDTRRNGNSLLSIVFDHAQGGPAARNKVPPVFIFASTGEWRDAIFLGLAVPGTSDLRASEELVAIWRVAGERRFQNYRARFTILDAPLIRRAWIDDIMECKPDSPNAPLAWQEWLKTGKRRALLATRSIQYRRRIEQIPSNAEEVAIIGLIHKFFAERPHAFEKCAAAIARLMLPEISSIDLTRPSRDGGRDAVGRFKLGSGPSSILVDFALEAKCYQLENSVGVREMSRLISRLRHRQFGILVTTSYVDIQAYREIKDDQHPIIVISSIDIVNLLRMNGHASITGVAAWLERDFQRL